MNHDKQIVDITAQDGSITQARAAWEAPRVDRLDMAGTENSSNFGLDAADLS